MSTILEMALIAYLAYSLGVSRDRRRRRWSRWEAKVAQIEAEKQDPFAEQDTER